MKPNPPSAQQINPFNDLDGAAAAANLLGRTVPEAADLLAESSLVYSEDYTWMGPEAFLYYIPALQLYLDSDGCRGDYDFAYSMIRTFRYRLKCDGRAISAAVPAMRRFCQTTQDDFDRLGFPAKYRERLSRRISELEVEIRSVTESSP